MVCLVILMDYVLYTPHSVLSWLAPRAELVSKYIAIVTRMLLHLPVMGERSAWVEGRIQPDMIQGVESELLQEQASVLR